MNVVLPELIPGRFFLPIYWIDYDPFVSRGVMSQMHRSISTGFSNSPLACLSPLSGVWLSSAPSRVFNVLSYCSYFLVGLSTTRVLGALFIGSHRVLSI